MNGMLIQPVENGFLVTEAPPPGANFYRQARYWVFTDFGQVSKFVGDHFVGDNQATQEPPLPELKNVLGAQAVAGQARSL